MTAWYEATLPSTDAALHDMLHTLFGIGSFDDITGDNTRWHQARGREIAKIRPQRRARHVSTEALGTAALYCHYHGISIVYTGQLYAHIVKATKARAKARSQPEPEIDYDAAIEHERNIPDSPWLGRLLRATGQAHRQQTLNEWKKARQ